MKTILLLDGDQYLHRACAAVERDVRWDSENHVLSANAVEAWEVVEGSIKKTLQRFDTDDYIVCLSDTDTAPNFRKAIDPTYKAARADARKPLCFHALKVKMQEEMEDCRSIPGLEADDVMGIIATDPCGPRRIIVSRDKDMRGIPGELWDGERHWKISEKEADYFHLYQTLVGDSSDGYKGCPGVGPKGAEKVLWQTGDNPPQPHATWTQYRWHRVVDAFTKAGLTEADALTQARLARILRWSDWDSDKKEPKLWHPGS